MFINQSIVSIVFKLINFAALIGLMFFIFKKYLKGNILTRIAEKEDLYQNLLSQQTILENEQQYLTSLIKQEKLQIEDFQNKIDEWKKKVILEQQLQQQEYNAFLTTIKKRNLAIALTKENTQAQNKIVDIVVADLENSLLHHFKDPKKNAAYMADIIHFMSQRIS